MINKKRSISVIVPVYNGSITLNELVERLEITLSENTSEFEVLLVNDGSQDDSWQEIKRLASEKNFVKGIDLMRNYGQHNATLMGIRAASNEIAVTLDDDLQNPPEEIVKLLEKYEEGYDVVYGVPQMGKHGLIRNAASLIYRLMLQKAMGIETSRNISALRVFKLKLRDSFAHYHNPFVSIDVLLTWGTKKFSMVRVNNEKRIKGESNYTLRMLIIHALNMVTGFSKLPLEIASLMGFLFSFFGLGVLIYVLYNYIVYGTAVTGFTFLASIISIFAGIQLFSLGLIGEYLARMYFGSLGKPSGVVNATTYEENKD